MATLQDVLDAVNSLGMRLTKLETDVHELRRLEMRMSDMETVLAKLEAKLDREVASLKGNINTLRADVWVQRLGSVITQKMGGCALQAQRGHTMR